MNKQEFESHNNGIDQQKTSVAASDSYHKNGSNEYWMLCLKISILENEIKDIAEDATRFKKALIIISAIMGTLVFITNLTILFSLILQ